MMSSYGIFRRACMALMVGAGALSLCGGTEPVLARQAKAAKAAEPQIRDPEQAMDAARKALAAGKLDDALRLADVALSDDKRDPRNTARALAVRGEVRLRQQRVAEAIADLDSALWVKGGLAGAERQSATAARARAYAQIGAASPAVPADSVTTPRQPQTVSAVTRAPQRQRVAAAAPAVRPAPVASVPVAPAPATRAPSDWSVATRRAQQTGAAEIAAPESAPQPAASSGVGNFFSNLFGFNKSKSAGEPAPTSTGTLGAPARPSTPRVAAVSSYAATRVDEVDLPTRKPARIAVVPKPAEPVAAHKSTKTSAEKRKGAHRTARLAPAEVTADVEPQKTAEFQLQLAAVRTPAEARRLGATVRDKHGEALKGRTFDIAETTFGNMGRFYRVRIGPFTSQTESQAVCASIRNGGNDCMVINR
ncbi:MAG: SPOR domain-containing protein [Hyphomicrobiaceae bacterium]